MFTFKKTLGVYSLSAVLALVVSACGGSEQQDSHATQQQQPASAPTTQTVSIPANAVGTGPAAYGANPLSVSAGSSVIWTNNDTMAHTATSDTGVWDTGTIQPGASSNPTPFNSPGTFPYHCSIHGAASMSGTIEVVAASPSPSPSPSPSVSVSVTPTPSPSITLVPTSPQKK
jgi:plastocyanin